MAPRRQAWLEVTTALLLLAGFAWVWDNVRRTRATHERMKFGCELLCVSLAYHRFAEDRRIPPCGFADIEAEKDGFLRVYEMIRSGKFVVRWNARLTADGTDYDQYVLGYESKVPLEGGWVLMGGGGRSQVSAEEFRALPFIPTR